MKHTREEYAQYEKTHQKTTNKNNEGREAVISLTDELLNGLKKQGTVQESRKRSLFFMQRKYCYIVVFTFLLLFLENFFLFINIMV